MDYAIYKSVFLLKCRFICISEESVCNKKSILNSCHDNIKTVHRQQKLSRNQHGDISLIWKTFALMFSRNLDSLKKGTEPVTCIDLTLLKHKPGIHRRED